MQHPINGTKIPIIMYGRTKNAIPCQYFSFLTLNSLGAGPRKGEKVYL
jgi:hypothetical protein